MNNQEAKEILIDEKNHLKENPNVIVEQCLYDTLDTSIRALSALDKVIAYCKKSSSAILPEDVLSLIRDEDVEIETDYGYEKFEPCEDAISRKDMEECKELMTDISGDTVYVVRMSEIRQLPPVKPQEQKTGHWKAKSFHELFCDNCGFDFDIMKNDFIDKMNYCPNCGAKMKVES